MREILFRGKRKDNGDWIKGSFWDEIPNELGGIAPHGSCCFHHVDLGTVGQFTGLTVKEKRWFEHDVISVRDEGEEIYRFVIAFGVCGGAKNVKHTVGYTGFHFIPANEETRRCMDAGARNDPLYWLNAYDCEVIGNIHDNPELLENP